MAPIKAKLKDLNWFSIVTQNALMVVTLSGVLWGFASVVLDAKYAPADETAQHLAHLDTSILKNTIADANDRKSGLHMTGEESRAEFVMRREWEAARASKELLDVQRFNELIRRFDQLDKARR